MKTISFDAVDTLIKNAPQGISQDAILRSLADKGYEVQDMSFWDRLKSSFGDASTQAKAARAEELSGNKGKFNLGDIADSVGGSLPVIGGIAGSIIGGTETAGLGATAGGAIGTAAGSALQRGIGQALGVRGHTGIKSEALGTGIDTALAYGTGKALDYVAPKVGTLFELIKGKPASIAEGVGESLAGTANMNAIKQSFRDPNGVLVYKRSVKTGESTLGDIAAKLQKGITDYTKKTYTAFQEAKGKIIDGSIDRQALNDAIFTEVRQKAGLDAGAEITQKALTDSGMTDAGARQVTRALDKILSFGSKDKGGITVKQTYQLLDHLNSNFIKKPAEYVDSNNVIYGINDILRTTVSAVDENFGKALNASHTAQVLQNEFRVNLEGTGSLLKRTENKLAGILSHSDLLTRNKDALDLLKKFEQETGINILKDIKNLHAGEVLGAQLQGMVHPWQTATNLATRGAAASARTAGRVAQSGAPEKVGRAINVLRPDAGVSKAIGKAVAQQVPGILLRNKKK